MSRATPLALLFSLAAYAQSPPAFEVASVKPCGTQSKRDTGGGPGTRDPGQYHFNSATSLDLIAMAYHVDYFQVISKSALDKDCFDLIAKVPAGATRDQFREMMQSLLAERFHLKIHHETRDFPAWEMSVAKSGLKIKESALAANAESAAGLSKTGDDGFPIIPAGKAGFSGHYRIADGFVIGRLTAQQQSVSMLSHFGMDDPPVIDKTGLTGKYDFKLEFSRELPNPTGEPKIAPLPDLFTALEQQLGLHITPKKLPFDTIVVESFDRVPTEN